MRAKLGLRARHAFAIVLSLDADMSLNGCDSEE